MDLSEEFFESWIDGIANNAYTDISHAQNEKYYLAYIDKDGPWFCNFDATEDGMKKLKKKIKEILQRPKGRVLSIIRGVEITIEIDEGG